MEKSIVSIKKIMIAFVCICMAWLCSRFPMGTVSAASSAGTSSAMTNSESDTIKVLFVGNSKTRKYDIPGKFQKLAKKAGKSVSVSSVTSSGKTLGYTAANKKKKLKADAYDVVVLQEHSEACQSLSEFKSDVKAIVKIVKKQNPDVKIVLRKCWIYKDSPQEVKDSVYKYTDRIAKNVGAVVSNDGPAFDLCSTKYPSINLFSDYKHQSDEGAYLAACCVYAAVFDESPKGITYAGTVTRTEAKKMQTAAALAMGY